MTSSFERGRSRDNTSDDQLRRSTEKRVIRRLAEHRRRQHGKRAAAPQPYRRRLARFLGRAPQFVHPRRFFPRSPPGASFARLRTRPTAGRRGVDRSAEALLVDRPASAPDGGARSAGRGFGRPPAASAATPRLTPSRRSAPAPHTASIGFRSASRRGAALCAPSKPARSLSRPGPRTARRRTVGNTPLPMDVPGMTSRCVRRSRITNSVNDYRTR
jgi:hypothetical protein